MSKYLFENIKAQKKLSDGVMEVLMPTVQEIYYPNIPPNEIVYGDLSSYARGTNNSISPDLDIGFFGVPVDDYPDWTPIGTRELTGKKEGITTLVELGQYDLVAQHAIQQVKRALERYFNLPTGSARFNFFRSWAGYPGWVCNLSLPHAKFVTIEVDLNIGYLPSHYGIEHAQRFSQYFDRVVDEYGEETAVQLIEDIKLLKKQGEECARGTEGWIDRTKKLAGFVVEGLFMHQYPPHTYGELMQLILAHQWQPGREPTEHWLGDQDNQLIDAGFTFGQLLNNLACDNSALPLGTWKNLLSIAQASV